MRSALNSIGYLGFAWAALALVCTFPGLAFLALVVAAWYATRRKPWRGWSHGSARWISRKEAAPLTRAKHGILIGRLVE